MILYISVRGRPLQRHLGSEQIPLRGNGDRVDDVLLVGVG